MGAALLLSAVCPHHAATLDVAASAPEHAVPACHGHDAEPAQSEDGAPASALDCGCPNCGVDSSLAHVASLAIPAPAMALVAVPEPTPTSTIPDARGDWMPPPYPGFSDNTVVLRT